MGTQVQQKLTPTVSHSGMEDIHRHASRPRQQQRPPRRRHGSRRVSSPAGDGGGRGAATGPRRSDRAAAGH